MDDWGRAAEEVRPGPQPLLLAVSHGPAPGAAEPRKAR